MGRICKGVLLQILPMFCFWGKFYHNNIDFATEFCSLYGIPKRFAKVHILR